MKNIFLIVFTIFYSCTFSQKKRTTYEPGENENELRIFEDLKQIITTAKPRNYQNLKALNKVANYINIELNKVCDTTYFQPYKVVDNEYKNVIGSLGVKNKERIIIGAHYDVCGNSDGADDNASGVVGLLELARRLAKENLKYRIDFVAYTLEEPPFFRTNKMGSYIHAKSVFDKKLPIKGMICLESIGYYSEKLNSQNFPVKEMESAYGTKGDFITVVQENQAGSFSNQITKLMVSQNEIKTVSFKGSKLVEGVDFSDHLNYWKFNYDAVMVTNTAFFRNKNYHTVNDKLNTLDLKKMNLVIQQLYYTIQRLE